MDFFEVLRKRARKKSKIRSCLDYSPARGIDGTIDALEEMKVGEPMSAELQYGRSGSDGSPYTEIVVSEGEGGHLILDGHHGTDGGHVVVMVFEGVKD